MTLWSSATVGGLRQGLRQQAASGCIHVPCPCPTAALWHCLTGTFHSHEAEGMMTDLMVRVGVLSTRVTLNILCSSSRKQL